MVSVPVLCKRFIGRDGELAHLHDLRREAGRSRGAVVLVRGEAGIGKSRLITEFARSLDGSRWKIARGACLEFLKRPYGPLGDILAQIGDDGSALENAGSKHAALTAIARSFTERSAKNGIIALVEDLHWADVATVEALAHLATHLRGARILIVGTLRSETHYPDHPNFAAIEQLSRISRASTIELAPFDGPLRRLFIDEALGDVDLPATLCDDVGRASDGNPFYMEELLKTAVERREGWGAARRAPLPSTVHAAVRERLQPFDDASRAILARAAVIGRRFELDLLSATLGSTAEGVLPVLRRARDVQLIEEDGAEAFRFRHALTREAIYDGFLATEVRPLHRAIALALEERGDPPSLESLAYHWWAAGDPARATKYSELAGEAAVASFAYDDAIAAFERALDASSEPRVRAPLLEKLGECNIVLGRLVAGSAAHTAAADAYGASGDFESEAACRVRLSLQTYSLDKPEPAADLERMLARLPESEFKARGRLHLGLAWLTATFNMATEATAHLARVDQRALADDELAARFYNVRAWVHMLTGNTKGFASDHRAWADAALRTGKTNMFAASCYNGSYCMGLFGLHELAIETLRAGIATIPAGRERLTGAALYSSAAFCALMRGDIAGGREAIAKLEQMPTEDEITLAHGVAWGTLIGFHSGDDEMVARWFARWSHTSPHLAEMYGAGCARELVRQGKQEDARAVLRDGLGVGERPRGNALTLLATARYGSDDDATAARAMLERFCDTPESSLETASLKFFDALRAERAGDVNAAQRAARAAAAEFAELRFPLLQAQALETAGDREAAHEIYVRCGAAGDVRRTSSAAHADGPPERRAKSPEELSAREREVALLVAAGRSNAAIANELSISVKTVEKYVAAAFRKTSVNSRAQLAVKMSQSA